MIALSKDHSGQKDFGLLGMQSIHSADIPANGDTIVQPVSGLENELKMLKEELRKVCLSMYECIQVCHKFTFFYSWAVTADGRKPISLVTITTELY